MAHLQRSFTALANFRQWQITIGGSGDGGSAGPGNPEIVRTSLVSAEFFEILGVGLRPNPKRYGPSMPLGPL